MKNIAAFIAGFSRFREKYFDGDNNLYDKLKLAQKPQVLVIACSDSRVDPAILLDAEPGELFVVRNVANLVPPHAADHGTHGVSAALEFAVCSLGVRDIIVLGHSQCGGIQALLGGATGEFISQWMDVARAATELPASLQDLPADQRARACERRAVLLSLQNLMTFPWIAERINTGRLTIHGWYFDLTSGQIERYDPKTDEFHTLHVPESDG